MSKKSIAAILFPSVVMIFITAVSFSNIAGPVGRYSEGLIIDGLILIFPFLFLLQGVICARTNTNLLLCLVASVVVFVALMIIYLNSSAAVYIFIYLIAEIIGYLATPVRKSLGGKEKG